MPPPNVKNPTRESAMKLLLVEEAIPPSAKRAKPAIMIIPDLRLRRLIASRRDMRERPNIVISRIFSAYFLRFPLISAANAEEESASFGGTSGQNRHFSNGRKAFGVATRRDTLVPQNF